jgi:hypothetical protein
MEISINIYIPIHHTSYKKAHMPTIYYALFWPIFLFSYSFYHSSQAQKLQMLLTGKYLFVPNKQYHFSCCMYLKIWYLAMFYTLFRHIHVYLILYQDYLEKRCIWRENIPSIKNGKSHQKYQIPAQNNLKNTHSPYKFCLSQIK